MYSFLSRLRKPWVAAALSTILLTGIVSGVVFQNCAQPRYGFNDTSVTSLTNSGGPPGTNPSTPTNTVCDPGSTNPTLNSGLVADLYYMTQNQQQDATTVLNFFNPAMATKSTKQVYFSQVNTRPQIFSKGFITQSGDYVKDDQGNKLTQWFALMYYSEIKVTQSSDEGTYEFASLSDDGAVFEAEVNGKWITVVNNDGNHPPQFGCSTQTLTFVKDQAIPIRVYYYQGPANHIANMLLWKKISSASSKVSLDVACGKSGTTYFFNPDTSTPLQPYTDILSRGWKVVPPSVFFLPSTTTNPCATH